MYGSEIRALRRIAREYPDASYVFITERKGPLSTSAFRKIIARAGEMSEIEMPIHPHMLLVLNLLAIAVIHVLCSITLVIAIYSIRWPIRNWRRIDSMIFGKIEHLKGGRL